MVSLRTRLLITLISTLVAVDAVPCLASYSGDTEDVFTISVAPPTSVNDVQVRYFLTGSFGGYGSYVANTVRGNKIVLKTGVRSQPAKSLKLIAYAPTRELAIARLLRAIDEYVITGIRTNLGLFRRILSDEIGRASCRERVCLYV